MNEDDKTSVKNVLWQAVVTGKEGGVQEAPSTWFFHLKMVSLKCIKQYFDVSQVPRCGVASCDEDHLHMSNEDF